MTRAALVSRRNNHGAFTLIEVMISIAITLALIIGVNQVFKVAADTVSTGQALAGKVRDGRSAQAVVFDEMNHVSREGPFMIISSRSQAGFETAREAGDDRDQNPRTLDVDGNNTEGEQQIPGEIVPVTAVNGRSHRLDIFSFFASDLYRRQTGNSTSPANVYAADQSSREAWITYGHVRIFNGATTPPNAADSDANYLDPGAGTAASNPKNFYAGDWAFGRVQMLLLPPTEPPPSTPDGYGDVIYRNPLATTPAAGDPQAFWRRKNPNTESMKGADGDIKDLEPLGPNTQASNANTIVITDARYDLAGTTFADFKQTLISYIEHTPYSPTAQATPNWRAEWWDILAGQWDPSTPNVRSTRFRCNPYPTRPLDARKLAQAAPVLLPNCSSVIVEFAGDFLTQQVDFDANKKLEAADRANVNFGYVDPTNGPQPDGMIDFYADANGVQHTRWYGYPRDVDGDGVIRGNPQNPAVTNPNLLVDVVPVRDVLHTVAAFRAVGSPTEFGLPFERTTIVNPTSGNVIRQLIPARQLYSNLPANGGMDPVDRYVVAWGPNEDAAGLQRPRMVRLIVTLSDPSGKLEGGQTYEYVANLP